MDSVDSGRSVTFAPGLKARQPAPEAVDGSGEPADPSTEECRQYNAQAMLPNAYSGLPICLQCLCLCLSHTHLKLASGSNAISGLQHTDRAGPHIQPNSWHLGDVERGSISGALAWPHPQAMLRSCCTL